MADHDETTSADHAPENPRAVFDKFEALRKPRGDANVPTQEAAAEKTEGQKVFARFEALRDRLAIINDSVQKVKSDIAGKGNIVNNKEPGVKVAGSRNVSLFEGLKQLAKELETDVDAIEGSIKELAALF